MDHFITFAPHQLVGLGSQHLAGGLVHIQKLIGFHVAHIGVALIDVQYRTKTMPLLPVQPGLLLCLRHQIVNAGELSLEHLRPHRLLICYRPQKPRMAKAASPLGQTDGQRHAGAAVRGLQRRPADFCKFAGQRLI